MIVLLATVLAGAPDSGRGVRPVPVSAPAIQVSLNNNGNFAPGGRVSVRVEPRDDGYLVVLRVDGDGHIRVLFPLDPNGDPFVRGGKEYELRGRDDRETFTADDQAGNGMIYAAIAHDPLVFNEFSSNGHWDYDALRLPDSSSDPEADVTSLVSRMTNRARFDYDAIGYRVQEIGTIANVEGNGYYPGYYDPYYDPRWRCLGCGWAYPGSDIIVGLNFGYSPYWDPWLYSPWGYNYGYGYGYGGRYWFPGTYPIVVPGPIRRAPPGTRSRPRGDSPDPRGGMINGGGGSSGSVGQPQGSSGGRSRPEAGGGNAPVIRSAPPSGGGSVGTRARPRPSDISVTRDPSPSTRPVFREPPRSGDVPPPSARPRQEPPSSARPQYREPPHADRSPPPPPPRQSSPPAQRSAPPSQHSAQPPSRSRPKGGG